MDVNVEVLSNRHGIETHSEVNVDDTGNVGVGERLFDLLGVWVGGCHCRIDC